MNNYPTEYQESVKFHQWLQAREIPHAHIPNENGRKSGARGAMNKRMGVSSGFPDYLVIVPTKVQVIPNYAVIKDIKLETRSDGVKVPTIYTFFERTIAIELKRAKKSLSKTSEAQNKWLEILNNAGIESVVCYGADEAIEFIRSLLPEEKVEF